MSAFVARRGRSRSSWRARAPSSSITALVINLERRHDRLRALRSLRWDVGWHRVAAVDGRRLSWDSLVSAGLVNPAAAAEARWAEAHAIPTICRRTGSFSPHLTLAAVGCALSHRAAWERLLQSETGGPETSWALVCEDDLCAAAAPFEAQLRAVVRALPPSWQMCFLGYHESSGVLLPPGAPPTLVEVPEGAVLTGLFGYLLSRAAAAELCADAQLFPLRRQIDVALALRAWPRGSRFAVAGGNCLLASPKSEAGACDTDVQMLGDPAREAHAALPRGMMRL